ncbi:TatD family hydrolase [Candidatus Gottesmanbacteria bacterium]|nr:TatD family hydrolase [Candidatus Gottesmanbacteria bacterium]
MYIDTHCHLNLPEFNTDVVSVIGNAKKTGVKRIIIPGVNLYFSQKAIDIALTQPQSLFASIGYHPYEANKSPDTHDLELLLKKYQGTKFTPRSLSVARSEVGTIIAIGECGLDYHKFKSEKADGKKDQQKHLFEDQLLLAIKYGLPAIIHCRDAFEDLFSVLDALPKMPLGVIHCFSGGLQDMRMATERNLYFGVDGNITYTKHIQSILPSMRLDTLLLETDAPYLTPEPHRGERNEPKYIPLIAKTISSLIHEPESMIENQTTLNAKKLFHINT